MFMYYDIFVSVVRQKRICGPMFFGDVVRQKRKIRRRWNLFRYTFLSASIVGQHTGRNKKREVKPLL